MTDRCGLLLLAQCSDYISSPMLYKYTALLKLYVSFCSASESKYFTLVRDFSVTDPCLCSTSAARA